MRFIVPLLLVLSLCSCDALRERQARLQAENQARQAAEDDAQCKSIGLAYGTPEYANCRQFMIANRTNQQAIQAQSAAAAQQNTLGTSAIMFQMGQPHY